MNKVKDLFETVNDLFTLEKDNDDTSLVSYLLEHGLTKLLSYAKENGVERIAFMTSVNYFGNHTAPFIYDECEEYEIIWHKRMNTWYNVEKLDYNDVSTSINLRLLAFDLVAMPVNLRSLDDIHAFSFLLEVKKEIQRLINLKSMSDVTYRTTFTYTGKACFYVGIRDGYHVLSDIAERRNYLIKEAEMKKLMMEQLNS